MEAILVQMTYAVEEDQPLGTAGCVKNIAELLDETFLVISVIVSPTLILPALQQAKQSKATWF